jgi:hypothetical protein
LLSVAERPYLPFAIQSENMVATASKLGDVFQLRDEQRNDLIFRFAIWSIAAEPDIAFVRLSLEVSHQTSA